jgi:hypothetical protein
MIITLLIASTSFAGDAVSEYANRRLVCWSETHFSSTTTFEDDGTLRTSGGEHTVWGVRDGRGAAVPTTTFAPLVGDDDLLVELQADADAGARRGRTLAIGGLVAGGVGAGALLVGGKSGAYPVVMVGSLGLSGGIGLVSWGLVSGSMARAPLEHVSLAYDQGLANQRCEQHNARLRQELGLTEDQTRAIDTAWTFAPRQSHLAVRPVVGLGTVGLTGTF